MDGDTAQRKSHATCAQSMGMACYCGAPTQHNRLLDEPQEQGRTGQDRTPTSQYNYWFPSVPPTLAACAEAYAMARD
jgi:hypothetical protein